jgi:uncharacterized protein
MKPIYIKKEVALKKVSAKYNPIVKDVKIKLLKFCEKIHSIYLYGSVATGKAKSPNSDMDLVIVLKRKPSLKLKSKLKELSNSLSKKYHNMLREIGFELTYKSEVLRGKESYAWTFFLSVLSVKIHGSHIVKPNMKYLPTKKLALALSEEYDDDLKESRRKINSLEGKQLNITIKHIMKVMLRVAYFIVLERSDVWTVNRNRQATIFLEYYPDKEKEIKKILNLIEKPYAKKDAIIIIDTFGKWVSSEFYK